VGAVWTKELRRHKGRTLATAGAVGIATALLVSMLAISDGIINTVEDQIAESEADILVAAPYDTNFPGGRAIADNLSSWPEVNFTSPTLQGLVTIRGPTAGTPSMSPVAVGVVPGEFFELLPSRERALFDGWFAEPGDPHFAGAYEGPWTSEVVISRELSDALQVSKGGALQVAAAAGAPAREFHVVGIGDLQLSPDRVIQDVRVAFFHLSELQDITGEAFEGANRTGPVVDRVSRLYVSLTAAARLAPDGARQVQRHIEAAYPDFSGMVSTKQDRLDRLQDEYQVGRIFYTAIGAVALAIGLLFVGCIVAISVSERTRDIGALRAMGISKRSIFMMILAESLVIVVIGAVIGILPGYLSAQALGNYVASSQGVAPTLIAFNGPLVGLSVVRVVMFGTLVSLYPAWRATKVPVVEALASRG
jgi:putative ABC transport system permease protein